MKALDNRFYVKFMQLEIGLLVKKQKSYEKTSFSMERVAKLESLS